MKATKEILYMEDKDGEILPVTLEGKIVLGASKGSSDPYVAILEAPGTEDRDAGAVIRYYFDSGQLGRLSKGLASIGHNMVQTRPRNWICLDSVDLALTAERAIPLDGSAITLYSRPLIPDNPMTRVPMGVLTKDQYEAMAGVRGFAPYTGTPGTWHLASMYVEPMFRGTDQDARFGERYAKFSEIRAVKSLDYGMSASLISVKPGVGRQSWMDFDEVAGILRDLGKELEMRKERISGRFCPVLEVAGNE